MDSERNGDVPKGIYDEADNRDFEGVLTAEDSTTTGIHDKLREVRCFCEEGGEAVTATIVDVFELAREGIEVKRKNATMTGRRTDLKAQLIETFFAGRTIRGQITAAETRIRGLKTQLGDAQFALQKLADESSDTKANLRAEFVAAEKLLDAKRTRVEPLERELATDLGRRQQFLAERRETLQTASCPLAEGKGSLQDLHLKVAAITTGRIE